MGHDVTIILDKYFALITSATLVSFALSCYVYIKSFGAGEDSLSPNGNTGTRISFFLLEIFLQLTRLYVWFDDNVLLEFFTLGYQIYDFHLGRELNPRIGDFDLKFFCELRPGLIGWVVLDLSFLFQDFKNTGSVSYSLLFVVACHILYVADALYFEVGVCLFSF